MAFNKLFYNCKAKARALRFGGEKRLEHLLAYFERYARPAVLDLQGDQAFMAVGPDGDGAVVLHGLLGIVGQVQQHLVYLVFIDFGLRPGAQVQLQPNVFLCFVGHAEMAGKLADNIVDIAQLLSAAGQGGRRPENHR